MLRVQLKGFDKVLKRLQDAPKKVTKDVEGVTKAAAMKFAELAIRDVAVDTGFLKGSISARKLGTLSFEVAANRFYAPFIEFGTKTYFKPYPGTEQYASEFRGMKRGNIDEFFANIFEWVKRKGISGTFSTGIKKKKGGFENTGKKGRRTKSAGEDSRAHDIAFLIMMSILKKGIRPRPFFFKQIPLVEQQLLRDVKQILNELDG